MWASWVFRGFRTCRSSLAAARRRRSPTRNSEPVEAAEFPGIYYSGENPMRSLFATLALTFLVPVAHLTAQLTPPNEAGITFGHVHLNVKDVDVQKKFWIEQFGAVPLINEKPQLPGVKVPGMVILFTKKDPTHPSEGTTLDHFGFKVR